MPIKKYLGQLMGCWKVFMIFAANDNPSTSAFTQYNLLILTHLHEIHDPHTGKFFFISWSLILILVVNWATCNYQDQKEKCDQVYDNLHLVMFFFLI
jgi:hypothetical protein